MQEKGEEGLLTPIRGDLILSVCRLASGKLGATEYKYETSTAPSEVVCITSEDEGWTWSGRVCIAEKHAGINSLIELSSGRLLVPLYWFAPDYDHPECEIPVDFSSNGYPNIAFVEDMILFSYSVHKTRPVSEWTDKRAIYGEEDSYGKIKAIPVPQLYE